MQSPAQAIIPRGTYDRLCRAEAENKELRVEIERLRAVAVRAEVGAEQSYATIGWWLDHAYEVGAVVGACRDTKLLAHIAGLVGYDQAPPGVGADVRAGESLPEKSSETSSN